MKKNITEILSRQDVDKKNFGLSIIDSITFRSGFEYVNAFTITSVFIHSLTGSVLLVGLAQFMQTFFMQLGKFINAPKIHAIHDQPKYMGRMSIISRLLWLVLSILLFLNVNIAILLPALYATIAISWFMNGKIWPVFEDHFARTILPRRISELLGYRELFGGLAVFLGSYIAKMILGSEIIFHNKYAILFAIGFLLMALSGLPLYAMKDPYHKVDKNPMPLLKVLRNAGNIIKKDNNYKWYLVMRGIWIITDFALLWTLIAIKSIGSLSDVTVSYMLIAQVVGRLGGGVVWGKVAKVWGSRITIIISQVINIIIAASMVFVLGLENVSNIIYLSLIFIVGFSTPAILAAFVYFAETAPIRRRPRFMVIESAISMPLAFVSYLFGVIAQKAGFAPIYIILIVCAVAICLIAIFKLLKPSEISSISL